jgi:general stress protein YciG
MSCRTSSRLCPQLFKKYFPVIRLALPAIGWRFFKESEMTEKYEGSAPRAKRGFAAMSPERQRQIASLGGRAAHQSGHAHEFTSAEARVAGKKRHERRAEPGSA